MKRILITGAKSYIGMAFEKYLGQWPEEYQVDSIDMVDENWAKKEFSGYDAVFHVAGIAHADVGHVSETVKQRYYRINTDLTLETARKAKSEGVRQFIFMSSMIVYGGCTEKFITVKTTPKPANFYGDSKWQADKKLQEMNQSGFHVVVLRPPMIYGKNSKGNYSELAKLACMLPIFPKVKNRRSMLYVGNLCAFVKLMIDNKESGVFFPQNREYSNTSELVKLIARERGHKIYIVPGFGWTIRLLTHFPGKIGRMCQKAFGDSVYDFSMSTYKMRYQIYGLAESVYLTER